MMTLVGAAAPWASCQARISSSPVSSPAAPAGGCSVAAAMPVTSHSVSSSSTSSSSQPWISDGGRGRVDVGQAGQRGRVVAQLGVVLHGARPERVGAEVDRVLPVGQPGEVGDQVALGHLGAAAAARRAGARPGTSSSAVHSGTPVVRNAGRPPPG